MKQLKILIVEDESLVALALQMSLERAGYDVCEPVATGEEAIESTRKENPDVVLMDVHLVGGMDGIEAARRIGDFSSAAIIFVTGYSDQGLRDRTLALRPIAYLTKPVEPEDVEAALRSAHLPEK
jgi:CheY-like chemotaxis protein